jgi:ABC-type branched-subunit amino acid transport system substrate-binding protein
MVITRAPWFGLGAAMVVVACSLASDTNAHQCESDGDCVARGTAFASSTCSAQHTCTSASPKPKLCMSNAECTQAAAEPGLCRKDGVCAKVLSEDCKTLTGVFNDDSIFLGSVFSSTGANAEAGQERAQSVSVAQSEIAASAVGLQFGGKTRSLAVLHCDEAVDPVRAATHLVTDLQVPAIFGAGTSGNTIQIATRATIPGDVLLFSPSATSASITTLDDNGLVWRTAPSDVLQVIGFADQVKAVEAEVRVSRKLDPSTPLRLSVLFKDDTYGKGLASDLASKAQVNGRPLIDAFNQSVVQILSYGSKGEMLPERIATIAAFAPAIVLVIGTTEAITGAIAPLEAAFPQAEPKPSYVLADGVRRPELLAQVMKTPELRVRLRGTVPGSPVQTPLRSAFELLYKSQYGARPTIFGTAGAYDSVYLVAYAIEAANRWPLTGTEIATSLQRVTNPAGTKTDVGGASLGAGFKTLGTGGTLSLQGASGPLKFDGNTGDAEADIDVWCVSQDAVGSPVFVSSGRYYDALMGQMTGSYDTTLCKAP